MNCACHGEPAYWNRDKRAKAGGTWECRIRRREHNRTRSTNPARYIARRRHDLAMQRARILDQLDQLAQEAVSAES